MTNEIRQIELVDRVLNPAEAEVWIRVVPELRTATTEIRGRFIGPQCAFASTVEIAYPFRPLIQAVPAETGLWKRVAIPEPSWWDPVSPLLYRTVVELWEDGRKCAETELTHGFRVRSPDARRPRWNGQPFSIRGAAAQPQADSDWLALRKMDFNVVLAPALAAFQPLWQAADRFGFYMLGRLEKDFTDVSGLADHACALGWIVSGEWLDQKKAADLLTSGFRPKGWLGLESMQVVEDLPEGVDFALVPEMLFPEMAGGKVPFLLRATESLPAGPDERFPAASGAIGWIIDSVEGVMP
jgi:hypothetical protein